MHIAVSFVFAAALVTAFSSAQAQNPSHLTWRQHTTEHFIVYYPVGQEYTAFRSAEIAEKIRGPLAEMYGDIPSRIHIVIRDDEDFSNGGAYFYDNKIEIYATGLDYEFRSYTDWLWNVVSHELSHLFSLRTSMKAPRAIPMVYYQHIGYQDEKREDVLEGYPNTLVSYAVPMFNAPPWLAEGAAQYQTRTAHFDSLDSHRSMMLRQAALSDRLLPLDQMGVFTGDGRANEMVYNHGYSLVSYIARRYGSEKIRELMSAMSSPTALTFDIAARRVFGISANQLYREWKEDLVSGSRREVESLGKLVEGTPFRAGGFLNAHPAWSPDGSRLAYVSNRGQDYHITACFVANLAPGGWSWKGKDRDEKKATAELPKKLKKAKDAADTTEIAVESAGAFDIALGGGIQSDPVWLDEWNILYNRRMPSDRHGSHWWDMYRHVINTKDPRKGTKKRITHNLRGTYPDLSPDRRYLVFVKNGAGQNNLCILDRNDNSERALTTFTDGAQLYRPKWSPDGSKVVFTLHRGSHVDLAVIDSDGSNLRLIAASKGQDRDPSWTSDGRAVVFSSDVTGIANLYRIGVDGNSASRLTNVTGGAFSPAVSPNDTTIAFSYYGPGGYEIRLLPMWEGVSIDPGIFRPTANDIAAGGAYTAPSGEFIPYRMKTLDFQIMPRVVNDRGRIKLGAYVAKNEVIDRGTFLFGGDMAPGNRDTDLFALFEYKKFVPTVFVEMYRQTRSVKTHENYMEEYGTVVNKRKFDLNEIDFGMRYTHHDHHQFEGRLVYSQYNARLEYTHFQTGPIVHKPSYTYSRGFDLALLYSQDSYQRARDEVINPRGGRKISFRYDRYLNFFLDGFEYAGFLREKYKRYPYDSFYLNWIERIPVPGTAKHTLQVRGQTAIIDRWVDSFYENQLGGPAQMRGYTYYSLSGRKTLMAQALYRFPILYDVNKSMPVFHFNHMFMGLFADAGRAWNDGDITWTGKGFKRDLGAELRFDVISFSNLPTMIEFSTAWGPDDTWIKKLDPETSVMRVVKDTQDPWKFYFNILFGFTQ